MDGWMDTGCIDGLMCGWMDRQMDVDMAVSGGCMNVQVYGYMDVQTLDVWMFAALRTAGKYINGNTLMGWFKLSSNPPTLHTDPNLKMNVLIAN